MANYDSNYAIAQEISARIGVSPIPFDSVYSIALEIYNELGGEPTQFDSVYSILLGILPLVDGGVASKVIDDNVITTAKTWSSSKINSELNTKASIDYVDEQIEAVIGAGNSDIEGKETEDFTFVQTLPVEGEEGQQVIIKGDNTDTLYKYVSGEWVEQTPDATKLYFDVENEALYSYVTAEHQFAPVSMVNTIVVGSNLNSNADLKALKTPGVYNVVQRLHNATKGDYVKNWTLYVESVDYEEYDKSDSVYQRLVSNYTIQKRTWSATRATNDGWSSFSTYYAGEIKDSTTSKYYTWSSSKIAAQIADAGFDVEIVENLPVSGDTHTIYFVPETGGETGDAYDEYMYVDNAWEKVGSTRIDLSEYAKKADTSISYTLNLQTHQVEFDFSNLDAFTTDGKYNFIMYLNMFDINILAGYGTFTVANPFGTVNQLISMTYSKMEYVAFSTAQRVIEEGEETVENVFDLPLLMDNRSSVVSTYSSNKINELLATKQGTLTAGNNISISGGTISATDTTYVSSDFDIKDLSDSTGLRTAWSGKQDALVAGDGIEISGNTISCNVEPLQAGENISVEDGKINALGYKFDSNIPSFVSNYYKVEEPFEAELEPSMMGLTELTFTGDANATTYTVGGSSAPMFFQIFGSMPPEYLSVYGLKINGIKGFCQSFDSANSQVTLTATVSPDAAISASPLQAIVIAVTVTLSGSANATTYTVTDEAGSALEDLNEKLDYNLKLEIENYGTFAVDSIDVTGSTITFKETLDASNAVSNALLVKSITDSNVASGDGSHAEGYKSLASGLNSHAEGESCKATSQDSHAEGQGTIASGGFGAHSEGYETVAGGGSSHAEGQLTKTTNYSEHAEGINNVSHYHQNLSAQKTLSSIGNGDSVNSRNALEVMLNGDMYVKGVGGYDGVHIKHETGYESTKTVQEVINSKADAYEVATNAEIDALFS